MLPQRASLISSTRRTETPARYILMRASSKLQQTGLVICPPDYLLVQLYNLFRHGLQTPFRMVCANFILPDSCKPCLFLSSIQFAQFIVPYLCLFQFAQFILPYLSKWYSVQLLVCTPLSSFYHLNAKRPSQRWTFFDRLREGSIPSPHSNSSSFYL